jgi:hypothetical protein
MFDLFFIVSLLTFSALCFLEVVVFDEEILLAMCFFCFVFFMFNSTGDSIFENLTARAVKFESDLLQSFGFEKINIQKNFSNFVLSLNFTTKFAILFSMLSSFFSSFSKNAIFKLELTLFSHAISQLTTMTLFENKLVSFLQKKSVSLLLYPLIFKTSKKNVKFLTTFLNKSESKL